MRLGIEAGEFTLDLATRLGIRGVPLSITDLTPDGIGEVLEPIRSRGLEVCQIGAMGYNPLHPDPAARAEWTRHLENGIPLATQSGCNVVAISCGSYNASAFGGADKRNFAEGAIEELAHELAPILDLAARHDVVISIEPYIKGVVNSPQAFDRLVSIAGSKALRINLDVTNFFDLKDLIDPADCIRTIIPALKGHVGVVHIKDIALKDGFHIHAELAPIKDGATDWKLVLEETARIVNPDTWVLLEHILSEDEGVQSVEYLRALADELQLQIGL